ncbi:unnamed protein product [Rotaria magnacalcarata]
MQLIVDQLANVVHGVKYRLKQDVSSFLMDIYGNFIVDCTGRNTSSLRWLKENLNLIVPTVQLHFGCGYVTFISGRFKTEDPLLDAIHLFGNNCNSPDKNTGRYINPIRTIKTDDENSLGVLSIIGVVGVNSEYPPNDSYEDLLEWAKEHTPSECYTILKSTKLCNSLIPYRRIFDDRKYVELLGEKWPQSYILLGDAMCKFNSQYAQGMTHAFRHARELGKIFDEHSHKLEDISYIFNRPASTISEEYWIGSTTNDWKTPRLKLITTDKTGEIRTYQRGGDSNPTKDLEPRVPLMIKFLQCYNYWFIRCAAKSGSLSTYLVHVISQDCNPLILMKPTTLLKVCYMALIHQFCLSNN